MKEQIGIPWDEYIAKHEHTPARPWLVAALEHVTKKDEALDLGPGALHDTKYLLEHGFNHVTAVDISEAARALAQNLPDEHFTFVPSSFETFQFKPETYDLISAQFSLPFAPPSQFSRVFNDIKVSLKKDGIFVGQLFGENDSWKTDGKTITFHTAQEVTKLLSDLHILQLKEVERDGITTSGDHKHWHLFHILAKK